MGNPAERTMIQNYDLNGNVEEIIISVNVPANVNDVDDIRCGGFYVGGPIRVPSGATGELICRLNIRRRSTEALKFQLGSWAKRDTRFGFVGRGQQAAAPAPGPSGGVLPNSSQAPQPSPLFSAVAPPQSPVVPTFPRNPPPASTATTLQLISSTSVILAMII